MDRILLVVEGEGEVQAAPVLVRRILGEEHGMYPKILTHRRHDVSHLKANDWRNFRRYLSAAFIEEAPILWMLDADDLCCWESAIEMSRQASTVGTLQPIAFSFWEREYETMFMHCCSALSMRFDVNFAPVVFPERIRGAKEWISNQLPRGCSYKERTDQPALTALLDFEQLRISYRSFNHFEKSLLWLASQTEPGVYPIREF